MLLVALALSVALAESPGVMPAGTRAARAGASLTTFRDLGFGSGSIAGGGWSSPAWTVRSLGARPASRSRGRCPSWPPG